MIEDALHAILRQWNVILFIAGLMGIAAAADVSGAFTWITSLVMAAGGGDRRRLFLLLYLAGAAITVAFSNDATAIVLTPIVYRAVASDPSLDSRPFLYACAFVANTASFGLPFSNPTNLIILPHPQLVAYLAHLGLPQLAAIALNLAAFLFFFRGVLRGSYAPRPVLRTNRRAIFMLAILGAIAGAYVIAVIAHWALGVVAATGAIVATAVAGNPRRIAARIPWATLGLLAGLFVLFDVLERSGIVTLALRAIDGVAAYGPFAVDAVAAFGSALLCNAVNNLPVAVASSYIVAHAHLADLDYALIAGVALGPNLLIVGSLSTILWFGVLRSYGVRVSAAEYFRLGALVVPASLAICVAWLSFVR